ncbi:hypothetical protein ACUXZZ_25315 [Streptomyces graminifolii]|uniref:hypothetical protein n=1 Tax=Streptomyces graminifolii TaxID=1266771 RepID=UPI00405845AF
MAGAVGIDLEGHDVPDARVVDGRVDGMTGGRGDAMEVTQDSLLDLLAGGHRDRHSADRRAPGAGAVNRDAYLER